MICGAILKDDTFLESGDTYLDKADFDRMDLLKIYDEEKEIKVTKNIYDSGDTKVVAYKLFMKDKKTSGDNYIYEFSYQLNKSKYNYNVSFDETKGVNRPILIEGMKAIISTPSGEKEVEDIYTTNWYNYEKGIANFAKMKYEDKTYVWIPRFAYDIQNFYEGRKSKEVPSSAISIVFLRETSSYMPNDEVLQGQYKLHPAFSKDGIEYSGIWVEEKISTSKASLPTSPLYQNITTDLGNLHMMTNMECGAAIYLMYALEAMDEIEFMDDEYVAASANGVGVFDDSDRFVTPYIINASGDIQIAGTYGDAFYETPWERIIEDYPTEDKQYVIRKFGSSLFEFTNSDGSDLAAYRGVIVVK